MPFNEKQRPPVMPFSDTIRKALAPVTDETISDIRESLRLYHSLKRGDPDLQEGFEVLTEVLQEESGTNQNSLNRGLRALFLADIFILPDKVKGEIHLGSIPYVKLLANAGTFRVGLEELPKVEEKDSPDTEKKLVLLKSLRDFSRDPLFQNSRSLLSEKAINWFYDLYGSTERAILENPYSPRLLLEGKLEPLTVRSRANVWINAIDRFIENAPSTDPTGGIPGEFVDFFIKDNEIHNHFWKKEASKQSNRLLLLLPEILLADPEKIESVLETIPFSEFPVDQQTRMVRKLFGTYLGMAASLFPNSVPDDTLINYIQRQLKTHNLEGKFTDYFEILGNKKAGILYFNLDFEARLRLPKPGQTKEEFFAEMEKDGIRFTWESDAQWPESQTLPQPVEPERKPIISSTETKESLLWGEALIPSPSDIPIILNMLAGKLGASVSQEQALELFDQYQRVKLDHNSLIVIPDLLPDHHPLKVLKNMGVLAIEQKDKDVGFVLQTPDGRIALTGELNDAGELSVSNSDPTFDMSSLHLLLNAACLFGKSPMSMQGLTHDELSNLRSFTKSWKDKARKEHLPLLKQYDSLDGKSQRAIFVTGKRSEKLILLTLIPPKDLQLR